MGELIGTELDLVSLDLSELLLLDTEFESSSERKAVMKRKVK